MVWQLLFWCIWHKPNWNLEKTILILHAFNAFLRRYIIHSTLDNSSLLVASIQTTNCCLNPKEIIWPSPSNLLCLLT